MAQGGLMAAVVAALVLRARLDEGEMDCVIAVAAPL